jgi:hypothetical protein
MPNPTRAQLLTMVDTYEHALMRIADKPREYRELAAFLGDAPPNEFPRFAYDKCARIAAVALRHHRQEFRSDAAGAPSRSGRGTTKRRRSG